MLKENFEQQGYYHKVEKVYVKTPDELANVLNSNERRLRHNEA